MKNKCNDDSCDLSHCAKCGSHMLGGYLAHGSVCDYCQMQEEQRMAKQATSTQVTCTIHPEDRKVRIFRGGLFIGYVSDEFSKDDPRLSLMSNQDGIVAITFGELDIILDNWNFLLETIIQEKIQSGLE